MCIPDFEANPSTHKFNQLEITDAQIHLGLIKSIIFTLLIRNSGQTNSSG